MMSPHSLLIAAFVGSRCILSVQAQKPCTLFDMAKVFPPGWPFVKGNFDDALCPNVWWHIPWFQALRYVLWIFLFALSVVLFFFTTCIFMPRLNGRRDTTGLCGKFGNKIQDKLDLHPKIMAWKRGRDDNWNGMLVIIFKHFNKSGTGVLTKGEFKDFFTTCGDGFIDKDMYNEAAASFSMDDMYDAETGEMVQAPHAGLTIDSIDALYTLGCRSWQEKHVQAKRDLERVKILSDDYPDITHSDYLVLTGSIGSAGIEQYEIKKVELSGSKRKMSAAEILDVTGTTKAKEEERLAKKARRASTLGRAGTVDVAARGGAEWANYVDEEFDVEAAMSENERYTVALPSLYVETVLFVLICAFLFLFVFDWTRFFEVVVMDAYLKATCEDPSNRLAGSSECYDQVPRFGHVAWLPLWVNGKINVLGDVGHKVCIFHFFFILIFVFPSRILAVLKPESSCAKNLKERLKPKPLKMREFRDLKGGEKRTAGVLVSEANAPGTTIEVKYGDATKGKSIMFSIPSDAKMASILRAEIPIDDDFEGVPVDCLITADTMTLCDKIKIAPLLALRNIAGFFVTVFNLFGISLALFIFFAPFIDFKKRSLELAHIRVSGVSFEFDADPIDAYMRWLNLKMVDMLSCGIFEKKCKKKADAMYLGFLDSQIKWNIARSHIPKGLDTSRDIVYFAAAPSSIELALQKIMLTPFYLCCPVWPACFGKHIQTAGWKLWLSKIRFGGRQPRLGGNFIGENMQFNKEGFMRVLKLNLLTGMSHVGIPCLESRFKKILEENIEWVIPPQAQFGRPRCTYILLPFPFDGGDETWLSMDEPIPVIIDGADELDMPIPKNCDANELTPKDVAYSMNQWSKLEPGGILAAVPVPVVQLAAQVGIWKQETDERRASVIEMHTKVKGEMTEEMAEIFIKNATHADGISKTTMTARELHKTVQTIALLAKDDRAASPVFRRSQHATLSPRRRGAEGQKLRGSVVITANPMKKKPASKKTSTTIEVSIDPTEETGFMFRPASVTLYRIADDHQAAHLGIEEDDVLVAVNGESYDGAHYKEARGAMVAALAGAIAEGEGQTVRLTLKRGDGATATCEVEYDTPQMKSLPSMQSGPGPGPNQSPSAPDEDNELPRGWDHPQCHDTDHDAAEAAARKQHGAPPTGAAQPRADPPAGGQRLADGYPYTKEEFVEHYGGTDEWLVAESYQSSSGETATESEEGEVPPDSLQF